MRRVDHTRAHVLVMLAVLLVGARTSAAPIPLDEKESVTLFGDFRFRFEDDWDSLRSDGSHRDTRGRLRLRARVGVNWEPIDGLSLGIRARSGLRSSQQSPHLTFWDLADGDNDAPQASLDRWFVNFAGDDTSAWLGRNNDPFWKQNELFWDDDVSLTGGTFSHRWDGTSSNIRVVSGVYVLPDGMESFAGKLVAGQLVHNYQGTALGTTATSGVFVIRGADETEHLRNGNGLRDYAIWTASVQARVHGSRLPVTFGVDLMHNFEDYSADDPDPFTAAHRDERTGFVVSAAVGDIRRRWDWMAAYYYAHIETLAVNASYAEDDWMRWGSEGQTDASDFQGHELRFALAFHSDANLVARYYLVNAITTIENGKRFRLDLNYRF